MARSTPRSLQGTYAIEGKGLDKADLLEPHLAAPEGAAGSVVIDLGMVEA
jgi:hypothetical protein